MKKNATFISNKTAINYFTNNNNNSTANKSPSKIVTIIKSYSTKNQNLFLKNLKKRKKLIEKYIPKNKKIKSYIELNYNLYRGKKLIKEINKENIDSVPIINKIINLQKRIEENNSIIKALSEENKLFHKRYNLSILLQEKSKNKKKLINLKENFHDASNNVFNRSILLSDDHLKINDIKGVMNIKECNEDLKIINNLKKNYIEGKKIEFPFYVLNNIKEEDDKKINISKIKEEIEKTRKTISDFEKDRDIFKDLDLDQNKRKSIELLKNKIKKININDTRKHKTLNPSLELSLSDNKGTYKLVTRCNIKNKTILPYKKGLSKTATKFQLYDFYNEYNRVKKILGPTSRSKNSSATFVLSNKSEGRKKLGDKNKFYLDEKKCFDSLRINLDSNTEIDNSGNRSNDINNLYSYLKFNNYKRTNQLFYDYIRKYKRKYDLDTNIKKEGIKLNPIISDVKQNSIKYNVPNKMKILNNSKYIDLNLFKNQKRLSNINKVKKFDERMKMIDFESADEILDLNQDLIKI